MRNYTGVPFVVLLVGVLLLLAPGLRADLEGARYSPNEIVIKMLPGGSVETINQTYGTITKWHLEATDVYLLMVPHGQNPESLATIINSDPTVLFCRPNYYLSVPEGFQRSSPFVDAELIGEFEEQTIAVTLALPTVTDIETGTDEVIALIDGGVDFDHPAFDLPEGDLVSRYDYLEEDSLAQADTIGSCAAHGTFVAGILQLVAPGADIYVYKVLDSAGQGSAFSIAAAVLQAVADSCSVINLSLGMTGIDEGIDEALRYARQHDIPVVASAGNDSTNLSSIFPFPASRTYATAVAAVDSVNLKADFSNYGLRVDVCAPGTRIYSAYADSLYAWWDGTSFSAPIVAAMIALVRAHNPDLTAIQIDTLIAESSTDIDSLNPLYAGQLGAGVIDILKALDRADPISHGDVTADGEIAVSDLTALVDFLFRGVPIDIFGNADATCDDELNVADVTLLVRFLFFSTPLPCLAQ